MQSHRCSAKHAHKSAALARICTDRRACQDCFGTRAVPDMGESDDGYAPCPACVVDARATFVVWD